MLSTSAADNGSDKFGRDSFVIDRELVNGDIAGQVFLMNTAKGAQEIT